VLLHRSTIQLATHEVLTLWLLAHNCAGYHQPIKETKGGVKSKREENHPCEARPFLERNALLEMVKGALIYNFVCVCVRAYANGISVVAKAPDFSEYMLLPLVGSWTQKCWVALAKAGGLCYLERGKTLWLKASMTGEGGPF
jgi:hypothetical protein